MNAPYFFPVLLVEDSDEDFEVTLRVFKMVGLTNPIYRCASGDEALDFLHRRPPYDSPEKAPRPALILLDLNLTGTDGREVLEAIKSSEMLRKIPVVVLTTSNDETDIDACYDFGANSYIKKPMALSAFAEAIRRVKEYWFGVVILPPA